MFSPYFADFPLAAPARRALLDRAGAGAQLAGFVVLLALALRYRSGQSSRDGRSDGRTDGSRRSRSTHGAWLDIPILPESRVTRRVALIVGSWVAGLLGVNLCFGQGDYMHLTRLAAHLAAALFPPQMALLLLPRALPRALALPYHAAHGAALLLLLAAHAGLYLACFAANGVLRAKLARRDVRLGLVLLGTVAGVAAWAARRPGRTMRQNMGRDAWVRGHMLGVAVLAAGLWWHQRWARTHLVEMAGLVAWAAWRRWRVRGGRRAEKA